MIKRSTRMSHRVSATDDIGDSLRDAEAVHGVGSAVGGTPPSGTSTTLEGAQSDLEPQVVPLVSLSHIQTNT